ncbi:MAG: hypothetical protein FWB74_10700, partial [Defluviitaleaceae bacterium]|nr:hypothetical protein [Defluviitaleaceae bacterium]
MDKRDNREYDGVAYIPGGHKPPPDMGETRKINVGDFKPAPAVALEPEPEPSIKSDGPKAKERKVPTKTQAKKTNYAIILVTTVFVGVIAAVFVFAMVIDRLIDNGGGGQATGGGVGANLGQTQPTPGGGITLPETTLPVAPGSLSLTGVVQEIRSNRLDLYVFEMSEVRSFFVENTSDLRDRFGNPITFPQFAIGDVVDVGHAPHSNTIENAQISAEVRAYREITGVMVDGDTLQIGNRRYTLSATPIVRYQNDSANISELDPIDQITVSIFQDRYVALIEIHRGHGEITLPDNESIIDGTVEVGIGIMQALGEGGMTLRVPAGQSRVTIRGSNIEPLMVDVNVPRGGLTSVSFAGLEYRAGSLIVRSNTEDAIMYIGER